MKVLIAEENNTIRRLLTNELSIFQDLELEYSSDGGDALFVAKTFPFDFFLIDWELPVTDGLTVVKQLRSLDKYKSVPILMITDRSSKLEIVSALKSGVDDIIIKPLNNHVIRERFTVLCNKKLGFIPEKIKA